MMGWDSIGVMGFVTERKLSRKGTMVPGCLEFQTPGYIRRDVFGRKDGWILMHLMAAAMVDRFVHRLRANEV
jgi:hypothetical protein